MDILNRKSIDDMLCFSPPFTFKSFETGFKWIVPLFLREIKIFTVASQLPAAIATLSVGSIPLSFASSREENTSQQQRKPHCRLYLIVNGVERVGAEQKTRQG